MTGVYDIEEAIALLQWFEAVGEDCLYAPIPKTIQDVARICAAVTAPVNVLAAGPIYTAEPQRSFAAMGAARLSLGSALARTTHRVLYDAAAEMFGNGPDDGNFSQLGLSISGDTIDALLT